MGQADAGDNEVKLIMKLAPEWVRTNDPVIRSSAHYRWATAPARFNKGIHNIFIERGISSENTAMLFMCFYGAIRQTNMATDSFNIYLSPVGAKSLNRFVISWQAGAKLPACAPIQWFRDSKCVSHKKTS